MVLDPTKGNVYQIEYQWLGYGQITFFIEDNESGRFIPVHRIKYSNKNSIPSILIPTVRLLFATYSETASVQNTVKSASGSLMIQGRILNFGKIFSTIATVQSYDANERAFLSLRNGRIFQGKGNNVEIWPRLLAITNDADNSCTIRIYINGSKTDVTNYKFVNEGVSPVSIDITNDNVPIGGTLLFSSVIGSNSISNIDIEKLDIKLHNYEFITITYQRNTPTDVDINLAITWYEDQ